MANVLLITGPGGTGKTTVAELIARKTDYVYLDGDHEDTEFFPKGGQWLAENSDLLTSAHEKILNITKRMVAEGSNVIIDYIIFGQYLEFIESFKKEFGSDFQIKVLFPSINEAKKRNLDRECWTSSAKNIARVFKVLESIKDEIGVENYLDTTDQTPEETGQRILSQIVL